jgi:hypothetical protein
VPFNECPNPARRIESHGGQLTLLPDRTLRCRNIAPHLRAELQRLQFVVTAILMGECEPRPRVVMNTKELRKLIKTIEARGGCFRLTSPAPGWASFFECEMPDALEHFSDAVRDNADAIFRLLSPPPKKSRHKRPRCQICSAGRGCRQRGICEPPVCENCGHECRCHFLPEVYPDITFAGGCNRRLTGPDGSPHRRCDCPGWPQPAEPAKAKGKKGNLMGLIREADLERSRERYERQSQQPKTHAEILVEVVREDPTLTTHELAKAAERSQGWVRRTLKSAGLKAAKATRPSTPPAPPAAPPVGPTRPRQVETLYET